MLAFSFFLFFVVLFFVGIFFVVFFCWFREVVHPEPSAEYDGNDWGDFE